MNAGLRRFILIITGVPMLLFGGLTIMFAQTIDSDSDTVGVEVIWECPLLQTPPAEDPETSTLRVSGFMIAQPSEPTEPPLTGPGSCPTQEPSPTAGTVTPTTTVPTATSGAGEPTPTGTLAPTATNSVGGSAPTVPVVAALPDTGSSPEHSASATTIGSILMLTAGLCMIAGGYAATRRAE